MHQRLNRDMAGLLTQKNKLGRIDSAERRLENRTKIQLGGLILKSGLANLLHITPGDDLQLDPRAQEKAALLLGVLIEAAERFKDDQENEGPLLAEWKRQGDKSLRTNFLSLKEQTATPN